MNDHTQLPAPTVGLGLKPQHYEDAVACPAPGAWFEVHPENYIVDGGPRLRWLDAVRARHPLSLHGVGLSLGAAARPDPDHLARLRELTRRYQPQLVRAGAFAGLTRTGAAP